MTVHRTRQTGFTLVEVLVAVSLLAILMVAMGSAMRTMAQTEARVDQRLEHMDDMRVVNAFLQQTLGRVSGRKMPSPEGQGGQVVPFRATANSIEWVGILPARPGLGGRYFFRLQVEDTASGQAALVLRYTPWDPAATAFPDWKQAAVRLLVPNVSHFSVQAEGRPAQAGAPLVGWPLGWTPGWPVAEHLPQRLMLGLASGPQAWPDLVVQVRPMTQGSGVGGGFTVGGSN